MVSSTAPRSLLPVQGATVPYWHRDLHELHNHRSTERLPEFSDVVVIGAGYAGVGTAYNLVKGGQESNAESPLSITILEARGACSGATGRNGGHLRPDVFSNIPLYIERYGVEAGEEFAKYEISHIKALKELITDENIDCNLVLTRTCTALRDQAYADEGKLIYDKLVALGMESLDDVQFVSGEAAEGISGIKGAKACITYPAATIWPYKFILHLLADIVRTGKVNLQTNTPVLSVSPSSSGSGFDIKTARGITRARRVVHANNAYASGLLPEYSASIIPCKGICCHISVPQGKTAPLVTDSYIIATPDGKGTDYLIPREDGSIVVGGARVTFKSKTEQWFNNTDDGTLIEAAKGYYEGYMQRTFRGWEDTGAAVDKIWTGIMGYTADSLPHVGHVPGKPGQLIVAGFNGHGMPVVWLAAKGVADMVLTDKPFEEVGLPRLMKTTAERIKKAQEGPEGGDILNG